MSRRLDYTFKGRTGKCCKTFGWLVVRGERPIKRCDSWLSAKLIWV